jgi:Ulp1 family protease
VSKSINDF